MTLLRQIRCDACGELVTDNAPITITGTMTDSAGLPACTFQIDLHPACVSRLDWPGILRAEAQKLVEVS
jgi:hypothetical protein